MAWLVREGDVLATLEIATSVVQKVRGLLGRDGVDGALLIPHARSVHTLGMRFPIDVAYLDRDKVVLDAVTMHRHRVGRPRLRARYVLEAEAGAFERWGLVVGDALEIKGP